MAAEKKRILIVEDSPMMVRLYHMVLGPLYTLAFAGNGLEGLDAAASGPDPDLLIVDINMPQMDGLEFVRRLRGELQKTDVPVLVCSTESAEHDRRDAAGAGADAFLAKPWTPEQLRRQVQDQLGAAP